MQARIEDLGHHLGDHDRHQCRQCLIFRRQRTGHHGGRGGFPVRPHRGALHRRALSGQGLAGRPSGIHRQLPALGPDRRIRAGLLGLGRNTAHGLSRSMTRMRVPCSARATIRSG